MSMLKTAHYIAMVAMAVATVLALSLAGVAVSIGSYGFAAADVVLAIFNACMFWLNYRMVRFA